MLHLTEPNLDNISYDKMLQGTRFMKMKEGKQDVGQ